MTTSAAPLPNKEEMRTLGIAGINKMLTAITDQPKDAWRHFHRVKGAIDLTSELALIAEDEAVVFVQKATEARQLALQEIQTDHG